MLSYFVYASHEFGEDTSGSLMDLGESGTARPAAETREPEAPLPAIASLDCLEFRYTNTCMIHALKPSFPEPC